MKTKSFPFSNIINKFETFFKKHEKTIFALLKELVETNSYSLNSEGIKRSLEIFANYVPNCLNITKSDSNLIISNAEEKFILLMGHMDTVFPPQMGFNAYCEKNDIIYGPGVFDMKGGLIIALFSLIYLDYLTLINEIPITMIVNSDEEIGSINSKKLILNTSKNAICAFVYEGAGDNNEVVVGRKGKIGIKLNTYGKAHHAAFILKNKPSAILDMAHKIIELEKLNNEKEGISANVGKIEGGIGPNTVPDKCILLTDFRYSKKEQEKYLLKSIESILNTQHVPGVTCRYEITSSRPCMDKKNNMELYEVVYMAGKLMGIEIKPEIRSGVSDANFIAANNIPVIDGMGPRGGKDHSPDEFIFKSSIKQRILLSTLSILKSFEKFLY